MHPSLSNYEVPNETARVGRLIKSITTTNPSTISVITHIKENLAQRDDFEELSDFLLLTASTPKDDEHHRRISAMASQIADNKSNDNGGSK